MTKNDNNIVEGVGNEVLWSVSGIIGVTIGSYFMYQRFQNSRPINTQDPAMDSSPQILRLSDRLLGADTDHISATNHFGSDQQCPVCLLEPQYPVETNCGHLFCAQCLIAYWRHGNWMGAMRCPVCRQTVTVLLQCFRENPNADIEERDRILYNINDYNRHYSGDPRPWLDYLWDLPTLLRHASSEFFSVGGLMYMFRIRIFLCFFAAIMYLISPLDVIPEAVFGILGLLDDLFVVFLLAIYITVIYRRFLATRWQG